MKQKIHEDASNDNVGSFKSKEQRRIVSWCQQEDDVLRELISKHGTHNWSVIASKFKDKTTRQCRRRWYTYLNSDFKKGGWSPEEDMLLCEAQKIFGNRWTEIAKVVSGRTDNAVKNRFSTLCKKKARREALAKENRNTSVNVNNKRVLVDSGFCSPGKVDVASLYEKSRRSHIATSADYSVSGDIMHKDGGIMKRQLRVPFAVLAQNDSNDENLLVSTTRVGLINANNKTEGTYLGKDDPKVAALVQQAELLSSLAVKVTMDNTEQSLENAWKVLQKYVSESQVREELKREGLKSLMKDFENRKGIQLYTRQPETCDSPSSSECSSGSTSSSHAATDQVEQSQPEVSTMPEEIGASAQSLQVGDSGCVDLTAVTTSPIQITPIFRSLASTIASPQFSESEKHFLLKTFGIDSPAQNGLSNPLQPPPCRKALLQGR
ncbi:hypothetical protein vseg_019945 [Gypsophila vaccaria]